MNSQCHLKEGGDVQFGNAPHSLQGSTQQQNAIIICLGIRASRIDNRGECDSFLLLDWRR
jgi:hypothetical protein